MRVRRQTPGCSFRGPHRYSDVANWDGDEPRIIQEVTETSFSGTYNLENLDKLPDKVRKLFPPDLLKQMAKEQTGPIGFTALRQNDPAFDEIAFIERAGTIIGATRTAEQNGQWDMARPFMSVRFFRRWQPWACVEQSSNGATPRRRSLSVPRMP